MRATTTARRGADPALAAAREILSNPLHRSRRRAFVRADGSWGLLIDAGHPVPPDAVMSARLDDEATADAESLARALREGSTAAAGEARP